MSNATVEFTQPKQEVIIALPDDHYKRILKMVKKNGDTVLRDKSGKATAFFLVDGKLKARVDGGELQAVIPLSEATKPSAESSELRRLVEERNPGASEEVIAATVDILEEGIRSTKKLVEMGVPLVKARQIIGAALTDETGDSSTLHDALVKFLASPPPQQEQEVPAEVQETAPRTGCE
jgi:hypothetical protein